MRQVVLFSLLILAGAIHVQAQASKPVKPKIQPPLPQVEIVPDETVWIIEPWEPEYRLEAWVATIKNHYLGVQSMARKEEAGLPQPDLQNGHSPLVTKTY